MAAARSGDVHDALMELTKVMMPSQNGIGIQSSKVNVPLAVLIVEEEDPREEEEEEEDKEEEEKEEEEEDDYMEHYLHCGGHVVRTRIAITRKLAENKQTIGRIIGGAVLIVYCVYLGFCFDHSFGDEGSIRLLWGTCFILLLVGNNSFGDGIKKRIDCCNCYVLNRPKVRRVIRWSLYAAVVVLVSIYLCVAILPVTPENFISLGGLVVLIVFSYIISKYPDRINWHAVFWGISTQFIFAVFILRSRLGYAVFDWLGARLEEYMRHTDKGSEFVFGESYKDHRFVFQTMPLIIFMSSTVNMLYHYGIIQSFVKTFGRFLLFCMGTSAIESVNAAFNMFLGPSESPLAIKPFLPLLTDSEMHAIMAATFASISGSVFGMLIHFGAPANHLLTASVMSAPAALAMAKLVMPETRHTRVKPEDAYNITMEKFHNVLEAISVGAVDGIVLVGTVVVNQIVFIAAVDFVDQALLWLGARAGIEGISFSLLCSYVFYPLAYVIGFPGGDLLKIGELMGLKIFVNSFVGFQEFGKLVINRKILAEYVDLHNSTWHWAGGDVILDATNQTLVGGILQKRSEVLGTYAFCGLNHIGAVGVAMGTLIALCPARKSTVTRYVLRANITGQIACFMTACIAGLLYDEALQT